MTAALVLAARLVPLALWLPPSRSALSVRLGLALLLGALIYPGVATAAAWSLAEVPGELLIGALLGGLAALPLVAARIAGRLVAAATLRGALRPLRGRVYELLALALFAIGDGPARLALAVGRSYRLWPIARPPTADSLLGLGAKSVLLAAELAAPLFAVLLATEGALLLVARFGPEVAKVLAPPARLLVALLGLAASLWLVAARLDVAWAGATVLGSP